MIIDFTRNFSDEEFNTYQELFDLWWRLYEEFREEVYELEDQPSEHYSPPSLVEPTDWMDLICSGLLFDSCPEKEEAVQQLQDICENTSNLIKQYKKAGYVHEVSWPYDCDTKTKIMKLLNKRESKFVFIFHPHPRARDILLLKSDDDYKEVTFLFSGRSLKDKEFQWLVDYRGWRGIRRVDVCKELYSWLCENCIGNWKFSYDEFKYITHIYFELEEDLILYMLTFKCTT